MCQTNNKNIAKYCTHQSKIYIEIISKQNVTLSTLPAIFVLEKSINRFNSAISFLLPFSGGSLCYLFCVFVHTPLTLFLVNEIMHCDICENNISVLLARPSTSDWGDAAAALFGLFFDKFFSVRTRTQYIQRHIETYNTHTHGRRAYAVHMHTILLYTHCFGACCAHIQATHTYTECICLCVCAFSVCAVRR